MTMVVQLIDNRFADIARALPRAASVVVRATAYAIQADIQRGMTGPHAGRLYGDHQASAPGEMPAVDTANLITGLQVEAAAGSTEATVYVTAEYAAPLEYGSPARGLAPRPYMTPAAERARPSFVRGLERLEPLLR